MTFRDKLKKFKSNLKDSSLTTYVRNVKRLRKQFHQLPIPVDSYTWLFEKKLISWFDRQPLNVRRHLSNSAVVTLQSFDQSNSKKFVIWKKRQMSSIKEFEQIRERRELSSKQKEKIPSKGFESLKKLISIMMKELNHILRKTPMTWSFADFSRIQELLIISLYYDYPIRLDYATLQVNGSEEHNSIYKSRKKPKGWFIRLVDYKTAKSLGEKVFRLNTRNNRLLNKFNIAREHLVDHDFLLTNKNKTKMTKQVLSKTLMRITKNRIGKSFSTQLIRILYAMKNRDIIESAKEVSEKLLHNAKQSFQYAKKS